MDTVSDLLLSTNSSAPEKFLVMLIAIVLFVAVMGIILFAVDRPRNVPQGLVFAAFAGPGLLLIAFGLVYPGVLTIYQSFFDRTGDAFVGFDNFVLLFTREDFRTVLLNTVVWVFAVPVAATLIGLVYAVLVDRSPVEAFAKSLIFLPMSISFVGASIIWKFMYDYRPAARPQIGLINQFLTWVGFDTYNFILNRPWNTFFLIVIMIWIQAGFAMTVLSAAIKAIPDDITEAARLDGVSPIQMFLHVTVPAIRPALVVVLTTIAIGTLKVFDIVRTMTGGNYGTSVIANEFYTQAFRQFDQGLASSLAVVIFILVIPIVIYNIRQQRMSEEVR